MTDLCFVKSFTFFFFFYFFIFYFGLFYIMDGVALFRLIYRSMHLYHFHHHARRSELSKSYGVLLYKPESWECL